MKSKFAGLLALVVCILTLGIVTAVPASATPNPTYPWRFATTQPCLNDHTGGGSAWPIGTVASEYSRMAADMNFVVDYDLGNGCDGYSNASTIEVWYYNGPATDNCGSRSVNYDPDTGLIISSSITINLTASSLCRGTSVRRANTASQLIGEVIGLQLHHNGNRSVMSDTPWTHDNIPYAQLSDGQTIDNKMPW